MDLIYRKMMEAKKLLVTEKDQDKRESLMKTIAIRQSVINNDIIFNFSLV